MALPIVRTSFLAITLCSCAVGISFNTEDRHAWYNDCKKQVEEYPKSEPIIEMFAGKDVTIGGVSAKGLNCVGGGGRGVAFTATANGHEVIVRMIHQRRQIVRRKKKDKLYSNFFEQVVANTDATGANSFTHQVSQGFTKELPEVYAEIWAKAAGQNMIQFQGTGVGGLGFRSPQDFMEFAKQSCEAIMFMWSVGMRHGDIQRANMMWDGEKRDMKLIDYENFKKVTPDGENQDVKWLSKVLMHYRDDLDDEDGWESAAAMVKDLYKHSTKYKASLSNFVEFYDKHFKSSVTLPKKQ